MNSRPSSSFKLKRFDPEEDSVKLGAMVPSKKIKAGDSAEDKSHQAILESSAAKVMRNPLLFERIMKNLPAKDLLDKRLTCKDWNTIFLPHLKEKHTPIQLDAPFQREYSNNEKFYMEEFADEMRWSMDIPFTKYRILDLTTVSDLAVKYFFAVCGKSVKSLTLDCLLYDYMEPHEIRMNFGKLKNIVLQLAPELAEFNLVGYGGYRRNTEQGMEIVKAKAIPKLKQHKLTISGQLELVNQDLLADLLNNASGLEHLIFSNSGCGYDLENTVTLLSTVQASSLRLGKLTTLKVDEVGMVGMGILLEMANRKENHLRLQEFSTSMAVMVEADGIQAAKYLQEFLTTQAPALKKFTLELSNNDFGYLEDLDDEATQPVLTTIRIPTLKNLVEFSLKRGGWNYFRVLFEGGSIGSAFPALKRLKYNAHFYWRPSSALTEAEVREIQTNEVSQLSHDGVTDLILNTSGDNEIFAQFPTLLPSVTRFQGLLQLDPGFWTMWPGLTILRLKYLRNFRTDHELYEFLTGITTPTIQILEKQLKVDKDEDAMAMTLDAAREICGQHKTQPGLSDLKNLTSFILDLQKQKDYSFKFTDFGGYFGLAMANPGLQHMEVCLHPYNSGRPSSSAFSLECREMIKSAFSPYAVIDFTVKSVHL